MGLEVRGKGLDGRTGYVVWCFATSHSLLIVPVGLEDPGRDKIHASTMASIVPSPNIEIPTRVCLNKVTLSLPVGGMAKKKKSQKPKYK